MKLSTRTSLFLLAGLPFFASCASYNDKVGATLATYQAGNFDAAADALTSEQHAKDLNGRRDGLLYRLEAGKALLDAGRYEESSAMFDRAAELVDEFDYTPDISLSEEFTTLLTDETRRTYRGTSFDRIQMEVYETLNYLGLGDLDEALVHMRKAFVRQSEAVARNADEISSETERAETEGVSSEQVFGDPGYVEMSQQLDTLVNPAYADYVNPCASFLSAMLLREEGDSSNAVVDLRKLIGMIPNNSYLRQLLEEFEASDTPAQDRVYVLLESGMAPRRDEFKLSLYTFQQGISSFAIPTLVPQPSEVSGLRITNAGAALDVTTQHLADVDSIVATDFQSRLPGIVLRTVISLVAKEVATHAIDKASSNDLGFVIANVWKVATSKADLRTWRTMGAEYQLAYLQAPEDGVLELSLIDRGGGKHLATRIEMPRARTTLIYVRSPGLTAIGAHVMPIGPTTERTPPASNEVSAPETTEPEPETTPDA